MHFSFPNSYTEYRWDCTPLQDAVTAGDEQLAHLLKSKGGTMNELEGIRMLTGAASRGNVQMLNILIKCAGLKVFAPCTVNDARSY